LAICLSNNAEATYIINNAQVGSNVVVTGSIDTTGLVGDGFGGDILVGPTSFFAYAYSSYSFAAPHPSAPGAVKTNASSGSGDGVGFCSSCSQDLYVPAGYTSNSY